MKWILPILAFALCSCASYKEAEQALNTYYQGKSPDRFWLNHGPPRSSFRLGGGGMIYDWNSPESDFTLPGYANTRANYVPNSFGGGTIYATTTYTAPTQVTLGCSARIITDSQHRVSGIRMTSDSWGFWTTSFAHEYFAGERKAVKAASSQGSSRMSQATGTGRDTNSTAPVASKDLPQTASSGGTQYLQ